MRLKWLKIKYSHETFLILFSLAGLVDLAIGGLTTKISEGRDK